MATHVHPYGLWDPWLPEDVAHWETIPERGLTAVLLYMQAF